MKKIISIVSALAMLLVVSCKKDSGPAEQPSITVSPDAIEAEYTATVLNLNVESNAKWAISSRTSDTGEDVQWVKFTALSGKGNKTIQVKVYENPDTLERSAVVTFAAGSALAYLDVHQAANPNPPVVDPPVIDPPVIDPPVGDDVLELDFLFKGSELPWPVKSEKWSEKAFALDCGLAVDNDGVAVDANIHRRADFKFPMGSTDYIFTFADPDEATAHNLYFDNSKGLYAGTLRYVGLPAVKGYKLTKIVTIQGASTKDPASFNRRVGVLPDVYDKDVVTDEIKTWVAGGQMQNQATNMGEYTYELTDTQAGKQYFLYNPDNASIYVEILLTYKKAE